MMKKTVSILLIIIIGIIFSSCEQARTIVITYHCDLTHYYSRHQADLNKVKSYIVSNGSNAVGTSFVLSIYGRNDQACYDEGDERARTYFTTNTSLFSKKELEEILAPETEFVYSYYRVKDNGDTLIVASYKFNVE